MVKYDGFPVDRINNNGPVQFFLYAVTIIVMAVPEGLPLAVTISLAYSMKKMMKDNNFVRVLAACETMGGATAICSDKTGAQANKQASKQLAAGLPEACVRCNGAPCILQLRRMAHGLPLHPCASKQRGNSNPRIKRLLRFITALHSVEHCNRIHTPHFTYFAAGTLTENRMTVTEGWFAGKKFGQTPTPEEMNPELLKELNFNIALNSKAFLLAAANGQTDFVGNRTECALLMLMKSWGEDYTEWRDKHKEDLLQLFGFSSAKKMASALVKRDGKYRLYNKGAAEWVLKLCTNMMTESGSIVPMTDAAREELNEVVVGMASRGLRCICLTYVDHSPDGKPAEFFESCDNLDKDLTALAIVGIKDPVRKEVPDAVLTCQNAGICVRMVTGKGGTPAQVYESKIEIKGGTTHAM